MQRIVQEQFERRGATLRAVLELNTPDAFRGVVRQGELVALLPEAALVDAYTDPSLAIRPIASTAHLVTGTPEQELSDPPLTRQVVMVTTRDRLQIPPIQHFYHLVAEHLPQSVRSHPLSTVAIEG